MSVAAPDWIAAMRSGEYERAWALSEADLARRDYSLRDDPALAYHLRWVWDGRPFDDRHVLVRCYHGLGDTIQFARFLPQLARRAASVTVEAQPRLLSLLREIEGVALVPFDEANPLPPSECDLEIMDLSFALRMPPNATPVPYLRRAPAPLPAGAVGLCLQAGDWDGSRSIPSNLAERLCRFAPVVSLDAASTDLPVLNPEGCPFDMDLTAAMVSALDLVITVDTMIAHLAGALGRPTWLLLKSDPDWRWCPERRTSAWYPTIRQYVQPGPGDWHSVIEEVEADLAAYLDRHGMEGACAP